MRLKKSKSLLAVCSALIMCTATIGYAAPMYSEQAKESNNEEQTVKKTSDFKTSGKIWIAGDSIAADHSYEDENTYKNFVHGWGEYLPDYLTGDAVVFNKAISGQSAKYFIEENNYKDIMDGIGEGDILLIQFGHNDYKSAGADHYSLGTDVEGSYRWYLKNYYIDPALKVGAMPVLCTSVVSSYYTNDAVSEDQAQKKFADSMRILYDEYCAQGIEIGYMDTYSLSQATLNADYDNAKDYFALKYDDDSHNSTSLDHVHSSQKGADRYADIISENLLVMYKDLNRFSVKGTVDGGTGTSEDPYQISNWAQLYQIMQDDEMNKSDVYYKLTQDLMPAMQQQEWTTEFNANLDGDNHTIINPVSKTLSSFVDKNNGTISNLKLKYNLYHGTYGLEYPFVKENNGTIRNCSSTGRIQFNYFAAQESDVWDCGMIAGVNQKDAVIENCSNAAEITTNANVPQVFLGGIAGRNLGSIKGCTNTGALCVDTSELYPKDAPTYSVVAACAGGIAGITEDRNSIENCTCAKTPECYTSLKYEALAKLKDATVPTTISELKTTIDAQLPTATPEPTGTPEPTVTPEPTQTPVPSEPVQVKKGDVNGDGQVTLEDANTGLKIALKINTPTESELKGADLDQNGTVELEEVQSILKAALRIIVL